MQRINTFDNEYDKWLENLSIYYIIEICSVYIVIMLSKKDVWQ